MRILSGLVAVLFFFVLFADVMVNKPIVESALFAVLGCLFALYALMGEAAANRWLRIWFGMRKPEPPVRDKKAEGPE